MHARSVSPFRRRTSVWFDTITAAANGDETKIKDFSGENGALVQNSGSHGSSFCGGAFNCSDDADGDGQTEVFSGAAPDGGRLVKVCRDTDLSVLEREFAFDLSRAAVTFSVNDVETRAGRRMARRSPFDGFP
jgi:hypothetical protein